VRLAFPLLWALPAWFAMLLALRRGKRPRAHAWVVLWAVLSGLGFGAAEWFHPGLCAALFPGAQQYQQEMLQWVSTGKGCEGNPACFLPQHLLHLGLFLALALATGGLGALAMGAVLFGWMGAYTGALASRAATPAALLLGWHPWAVLRVGGFLLLGLACAEPLVRLGLPPLPGRRRLFLWGLALCLADALLKGLAAAWWRLVVLLPLLGRG
jgi:hypothetical protein